MSEPTLVPSGGGEIVGDSPDRRVEILSDDETLHATWSRFGPHRNGADLHVHRHHTDLFYVLDGELTLRLGTEDKGVPVWAGTLARVPPFVVHGFRNGSDMDVRYLNFHAPGQRFADYMRALRDGRTFFYDQHPPPPQDPRPPSNALIGGEELIVDRPDLRLALLGDVEEIAIAEVWSEPGDFPPPHVHHRHVESYYVLEGELTLMAAGREIRAQPGSWVQVPRGVPHTFAFSGDGQTRCLNLHTPGGGFGPFVRGKHQAELEEEVAAVRAAFDQAPA